jgi:hypothetical protein
MQSGLFIMEHRINLRAERSVRISLIFFSCKLFASHRIHKTHYHLLPQLFVFWSQWEYAPMIDVELRSVFIPAAASCVSTSLSLSLSTWPVSPTPLWQYLDEPASRFFARARLFVRCMRSWLWRLLRRELAAVRSVRWSIGLPIWGARIYHFQRSNNNCKTDLDRQEWLFHCHFAIAVNIHLRRLDSGSPISSKWSKAKGGLQKLFKILYCLIFMNNWFF